MVDKTKKLLCSRSDYFDMSGQLRFDKITTPKYRNDHELTCSNGCPSTCSA